MIRYFRSMIRLLAPRLYSGGASDRATEMEAARGECDDDAMEVLCKNAIRTNWGEPDANRVWQQLSDRVMGPFGTLAVEGPVGTAFSTTSGDEPAPFLLKSPPSRPQAASGCDVATDMVGHDLLGVPEGRLTLR